MKKLLLFSLLLFFCVSGLFAQATVVYVVRHAEKNEADPADKNPALSAAGKLRATRLDSLLRKEKIEAVFSTDYLRTLQTVTPLAKTRGLGIILYAASDFQGIAHKIGKEYKGKTILVVGHSNTVLPIIRALGGDPQLQEIRDSDYNYLFRITQLPNGQTKTVTQMQ